MNNFAGGGKAVQRGAMGALSMLREMLQSRNDPGFTGRRLLTPEERAALASSRVFMRAPEDAVPQILQSGELKNQLQTNTSRGHLDPEGRRRFEKSFFGVPEDAPDEFHPKYGYLSTDPYGRKYYPEPFIMGGVDSVKVSSPELQYGPLSLLLKRSEHPRVMYTPGDSLEAWDTLPLPLEQQRVLGDRTFSASKFGPTGGSYTEAQVFGKLPLSDFEKLIQYSSEPSPTMQRLAAKARLPYENAPPPDAFRRYLGRKVGDFVNSKDPYADQILRRAKKLGADWGLSRGEEYSLPIRIENYAEGGRVTDELLNSVMQAESGGDPNAVSPKGALGAYQFMPTTARELDIDPLDPAQARGGARRYLQQLLEQTGSLEKALTAYNWGIGRVQKYGADAAPQETKDYVRKVLARVSKNINQIPDSIAAQPHNPLALPPLEPSGALPVPATTLASSAGRRTQGGTGSFSSPPMDDDDPVKSVDAILKDPIAFSKGVS